MNRILIVDDSRLNCRLLETLLRSEYELAFASTGEECLRVVTEFQPHVVLLDIVMPGIDGYETCSRIKSGDGIQIPQVILVSTRSSMPERLAGYEVKADDYVVKPFDPEELLAKVRVHMRLCDAVAGLRAANATLQRFNGELEARVEQRTAEVLATRDIALLALAELAESRDPETGEHLDRIRTYSRILAEELAARGPYADRIDANFIADVYRSSPLHDIGKVGIPDAVLLYPGRLLPEEFEVMKRHTVIGAESLRKAAAKNVHGGFLTMAYDIARHHHEHFDGKGYPDGLAGEAIPLSARIVAVADVFDALTSRRVYKPAYDPELAYDLFQREQGAQFDPAIIQAFLARYQDFLPHVPSAESGEGSANGESLPDAVSLSLAVNAF